MPSRRRATDLAVAAAPVLFAVPVLYAIAWSLTHVAGIEHPYYGDVSGTVVDALALCGGEPVYQDPDDGYTPLAYTPLFTALLAASRVDAVVVTILATLALVALAARLAYAPREAGGAGRAAAAAGAIGIGALGWWLVTIVPFSFVYAPRPDQLSWALALGGLVALPWAARGSRWAQAGALLALSAAFWVKQPAIVAGLAAVVWLGGSAALGRIPPGRALGLAGGLVALNLAAFAMLSGLTDGWAREFIVDIPDDRPRVVGFGESLRQLGEACAVAAVLAAALWALAVAARRDRPEENSPPSEDSPPDGASLAGDLLRLRIAEVLVAFLVLGVPAAAYFRGAQGAAPNQYIGIAWALALLIAIAWALARRRSGTAAAAAGLVAGAFAISQIATLRDALDPVSATVPEPSTRAFAVEEPAALRALARTGPVYHPVLSGLPAEAGATPYPGQDNAEGLLGAGRQPGHLRDALLDRRFATVYLFQDSGPRGDSRPAGPWETNYLWKLNQVVRARYRPARFAPGVQAARELPAGFAPFRSPAVLARRPGPEPARWMRACFGPFRIGGIDWRIGPGGGFWCRREDVLRLVRTPARTSEVRADDVRLGRGSSLAVTVARAATVEASAPGWRARRAVVPGRRTTMAVPPGTGGPLRLVVPGASGAAWDLSGLRAD